MSAGNEILTKNQKNRLYIRGVINQDPSTEKNPVELFEQANKEEADFDVLLPAEIDEATKFFAREMRKLPTARDGPQQGRAHRSVRRQSGVVDRLAQSWTKGQALREINFWAGA